MSTIEIVSKIEALKEWEALAEEAAAEIESLRDDIKKEMDGRGVEVIEAGQYIARFTTVQSNRFDTKRFKNELGEDVYKRFCKETISRRFTISGKRKGAYLTAWTARQVAPRYQHPQGVGNHSIT